MNLDVYIGVEWSYKNTIGCIAVYNGDKLIFLRINKWDYRVKARFVTYHMLLKFLKEADLKDVYMNIYVPHRMAGEAIQGLVKDFDFNHEVNKILNKLVGVDYNVIYEKYNKGYRLISYYKKDILMDNMFKEVYYNE